MDAFEDGFGGEGEVEVDPAAEFLAKEQQQLGEIGEDMGLGSPAGQEEAVIQAFQEEVGGVAALIAMVPWHRDNGIMAA